MATSGNGNTIVRAVLLAVLASASGCVVAGSGVQRDRYTRCDPGTYDYCVGSTTCEAANTTTDPTMTSVGGFCTVICHTSADCPGSLVGKPTECIVQLGATTGQCYEDCSDGTCPTGFQCSANPGMSPFCVPYGAF